MPNIKNLDEDTSLLKMSRSWTEGEEPIVVIIDAPLSRYTKITTDKLDHNPLKREKTNLATSLGFE